MNYHPFTAIKLGKKLKLLGTNLAQLDNEASSLKAFERLD
jgi:hypothetical protein